MRRYRLPQIGDLCFTHAAVKGPLGVAVLRLLVDTGSTYTILPVEVLEALGCDPTASKARERIATASGYLLAPRVTVSWIQALGKKRRNMQVVAHTLPPAGPIEGLLGMDFLTASKARIYLGSGVIEVP